MTLRLRLKCMPDNIVVQLPPIGEDNSFTDITIYPIDPNVVHIDIHNGIDKIFVFDISIIGIRDFPRNPPELPLPTIPDTVAEFRPTSPRPLQDFFPRDLLYDWAQKLLNSQQESQDIDRVLVGLRLDESSPGESSPDESRSTLQVVTDVGLQILRHVGSFVLGGTDILSHGVGGRNVWIHYEHTVEEGGRRETTHFDISLHEPQR
jgi:hypothetical protein